MLNQQMTPSGQKRTLDAQYVKEQAQGLWLDILQSLCPELGDAISKSGKSAHTYCPVHEGKNGDAFRMWKDADQTGACICNSCGNKADGYETIMWITGWDFPSTVAEVGNWLRLDPDHQHLPTQRIRRERSPEEIREEEERVQQERERIHQSQNKVWTGGYNLDAPAAEPARMYLARRGLSVRHALKSRYLRFHPRLAYFDTQLGKVTGYWPAILALFMGADGKPATIHRIYITEEGYKAPVREDGSSAPIKKSMEVAPGSTMSGGCIPLFDIQPENFGNGKTAIALTEGIENGLAVMEACENGIPVWPVTSATLMEKVQLPDIVDVVFIYADWEKAKEINGKLVQPGIEAARRLKERLTSEGKLVKMWSPTPPLPRPSRDRSGYEDEIESWDWLENYCLMGPEGVPNPMDYEDSY